MSSKIGNSHRLQSSRQEFHTAFVSGKQPKLNLNTSVFCFVLFFSFNFDIQAYFAAVFNVFMSFIPYCETVKELLKPGPQERERSLLMEAFIAHASGRQDKV